METPEHVSVMGSIQWIKNDISSKRKIVTRTKQPLTPGKCDLLPNRRF